MTRSLRTFAGVFLAALFLATGLALGQSQPGSAKVTPRPAGQPATNGVRPAAAGAAAPRQPAVGNPATPAVAQPAKPDPRLEYLLRQWEVKSAEIKSLHGKHMRSRSNSVFATDARASGEFYFEAPDKGRIDLVGRAPKKDEASSKKTKEGESFTLTADRDEKWVCDGTQVLMINEAQKEFESIELPKEMRGANIIESPLPFLFGMKVADAKQRFDMELMQYDEKTQRAVIKAIPLQNKDAQNFIRAIIWLDTKRYVPTYVGLTDPAGTITTEYIFQNIEINNDGIRGIIPVVWGRDPFKPNLKGYKEVQPPDPVQRVGGVQPNGAANKVKQAGGPNQGPANGTPVTIPGGVRPTPRATQSGSSQPSRTKQ